MSLFDYLNSDSTTSSTSSTASLLQQIAAQQGISVPSDVMDALNGDSTSTGSTSSVQISSSAQAASAEAADADKDPATLASELRTTLDQQYSTSGAKTPDMSSFSGRGLAIVALNNDGSFSPTEVYAAKTELRERDRQSAVTFLSSGDVTAASLKAYTDQLATARQSMSAEEQQLRDADPSLQ